MRSTFMGLEASKKGLFVQQSALYTTGHNISNANTEGYTRQRVNMEASPGFPYPGLNSPQYPGHMGTGVQANSIQRMRDEFTDRQFRQETGKLGYWDSTLKSINQMEDILTEPSEYGINQAFNDFWKALQDVSTNPEDTAARKVAISKGEGLAEAFNYNYTQLEIIQSNIGNEIFVETDAINSYLKQIAYINSQVQALEPNGYVTNDLYDARDVLIDKLSEYLPITTERVPSGGLASEVAEGSLTVKYNGISLVDSKNYAVISVEGANGQISANAFDPFTQLTITASPESDPARIPGGTVDYATMDSTHGMRGKLLALIDAYGHGTAPGSGTYPDMMQQLNSLANTFKDEFNALHATGFTLATGTVPSANGGEFFTGTGAKNLAVDLTLKANPYLLAASTAVGEEGNGKFATKLANLQFTGIASLGGATFQKYYESMIGDLAVQGKEAERMQFNSTTQRLTIENNRASMNSVSLDEEMSNMITFQQAYNANARMITVVDETLDKIINGMGRAGI